MTFQHSIERGARRIGNPLQAALAVGLAALAIAGTALAWGADSAQAKGYPMVDPPGRVDPVQRWAPEACGWNTHGQDGTIDNATCVKLLTASFTRGELASSCPREYPYVYWGSFSSNPWWFDRSHFPGWAVVRELSERYGARQSVNPFLQVQTGNRLSYSGSADKLGYVIFEASGFGSGRAAGRVHVHGCAAATLSADASRGPRGHRRSRAGAPVARRRPGAARRSPARSRSGG